MGPSAAGPHGSSLLVFSQTRGVAHFLVGPHFQEEGAALGSQGGWMRPGIQAGCRGWAVATDGPVGQGPVGQRPGRGEYQGLRCGPLGSFWRMLPKCGECLLRVGDGGGRLVHAELRTLVLFSACSMHPQVPVETWVTCGGLLSVCCRACLGWRGGLWPSDPHPALREARSWGTWPSPHPISPAAHSLGPLHAHPACSADPSTLEAWLLAAVKPCGQDTSPGQCSGQQGGGLSLSVP